MMPVVVDARSGRLHGAIAMRRDMIVSAAVSLLAIGARLPGVYDQPFWQDEVASARILREPTLGGMLGHVARSESTPPFWYFLGWLVHAAAVPLQDERLLSVLFGGIFAGLVVTLARRFVPLRFAALAGLMAALGGEFVGHGHELRAYELLALLAACFALCLLAELKAPSRRLDVVLGATVAAGGLTHFFFAFSVLAVLGWLWIDPGARRVRRRATIAILSGGAVAAAWGPVMLTQYHPARFWWIGSFRLRYVAAVPLRLLTYAYSDTSIGPLMSLAALVVVGAGCFRLARRSPAGRLVAVLALVPIAEAAAVWAVGMPIFDLRNLIGVGAFVAVSVGVAIDGLPRRLAPAAAVAIAALLVFSFVSETKRIPPYDLMARALIREGWNRSAPIAVFGNPFRSMIPLEWYLPRQPLFDILRPLRLLCREIFVVERGGSVVRLRMHAPLTIDPSLRHATLLVARAPARGCRKVAAPLATTTLSSRS